MMMSENWRLTAQVFFFVHGISFFEQESGDDDSSDRVGLPKAEEIV